MQTLKSDYLWRMCWGGGEKEINFYFIDFHLLAVGKSHQMHMS